ncbi:MAG: YceI family protein [Pirellulales bacterium]
MTRRALIVVFILLANSLATPSVGRAVDIYALDPAHTSIVFGIGHNNLSFVYGFFRKAQGSYSIDLANAANCRFRFDVDVNSIFTNHPQRDEHLQSPEFFDVERFPKMSFTSTSCRLANTQEGKVFYVTGNMTIHGVTQQVTLPLRMLAEGEGVGTTKDRRTAFLCQFELKRSDYGMNKIPIVANAVGITISFEGVLQRDAATALR